MVPAVARKSSISDKMLLVCSAVLLPFGLSANDAGEIDGIAVNHRLAHTWSALVTSLADIWQSSPAFNAFRGTDWMKQPSASCPRRFEDFGGCRCQALALTGDARAGDPVCHLSSHHALIAELADQRDDASGPTASQRLKTLWWSVRSTSSRHYFPR